MLPVDPSERYKTLLALGILRLPYYPHIRRYHLHIHLHPNPYQCLPVPTGIPPSQRIQYKFLMRRRPPIRTRHDLLGLCEV